MEAAVMLLFSCFCGVWSLIRNRRCLQI